MSTPDLLQKKPKNLKNPKGLELDLEKINSEHDFEKNLSDLFRAAFITNCDLDEASVTEEELETLQDLSAEEVLENFKDLLTDLLTFKKNYKSSDKAELAQRNEQFEDMLQKLESEIRGHIRTEHQLKLQIESSQNKIEELEKCKIESEEKLQKYESKTKKEGNKKDESKLRLVQKFEFECTKFKLLLEEKIKENEKLKKEIESIRAGKTEKGSSRINTLKTKLGEKTNNLSLIQNLIKDKEKQPVRPVDGKKKKSSDENSRNSPSPFRSKKENDSSLSEFRPSTGKKTMKKSHVRSNSDQTRAISLKKISV